MKLGAIRSVPMLPTGAPLQAGPRSGCGRLACRGRQSTGTAFWREHPARRAVRASRSEERQTVLRGRLTATLGSMAGPSALWLPTRGREDGAGGGSRTLSLSLGKRESQLRKCLFAGLELDHHWPPQERHSAPHTCQNGVRVVHKHLCCNVNETNRRGCQEGQVQPKRDLNHRLDSRL